MSNSDNGKVDGETIFHYQQEGELVTADYSGGSILQGHIIAQIKEQNLQMLYHCYTSSKELKAGKATAEIVFLPTGKMKLLLDWRWMDSEETGRSIYIEI